MSDGALFKPDKDYSKEADKIIPEAEALAKVDQFILPQGYDADRYKERHPERH